MGGPQGLRSREGRKGGGVMGAPIVIPTRELRNILAAAERAGKRSIDVCRAHELYGAWRWWRGRYGTVVYRHLLADIGEPLLTFDVFLRHQTLAIRRQAEVLSREKTHCEAICRVRDAAYARMERERKRGSRAVQGPCASDVQGGAS